MSKHLLDFKDIEKKDIEKLIDITGKLNPKKTDEISSISLLKFDERNRKVGASVSQQQREPVETIVRERPKIGRNEKVKEIGRASCRERV